MFFYEKKINFIYYVDKTFPVIKIMDFNGTGPDATVLFPKDSAG